MCRTNIQLIDRGKTNKLEKYIQQHQDSEFNLFCSKKDAFLIMDWLGHIKYGNSGCLQLAGYTNEELVNKTIYDLVPKEDIDQNPFFSERTEQFEARFFIRSFREPIRQSFLLIPIFHDHELIGKYMVLKEMRKNQKEATLGEAYNPLIDHSPYGIVMIKNDKIIDINMVGKKIIGIKRKHDIIGKSILSFIPKTSNEEFSRLLKSIDQEKPTDFIKQKMVRINGAIIEVNCQALSIPYKNENMTQLIIKDSDGERKALDLSILIATGLAYEIKNPLTRIEGFTALMRENPSHKDRYYSVIKEDIQHLKAIIKDILILDREL